SGPRRSGRRRLSSALRADCSECVRHRFRGLRHRLDAGCHDIHAVAKNAAGNPDRTWLVARGAEVIKPALRLVSVLVLAVGVTIVASARRGEAACTGSSLPAFAASLSSNEWCQLATINNTGLAH